MTLLTLPIVTWVLCGATKFAINFIQTGYGAASRIGHGGFPSNHTAILSSILWALLLIGDWHMAGLALAILMVLIFDATGLRREVGRHAVAINHLSGSQLREIMGHKAMDIIGGLLFGLAMATIYWSLGAIS